MRNPEQLRIGKKPAPGDLAYLQGFVNTADLESGRDDFASREALAGWLRHHGLLDEGTGVSEEERLRVVEFREALRSRLGANNGEPLDPDSLDKLEQVAAVVPLHLHHLDDGGVELHAAGDGVSFALGELQAVIYRAMLEGTWSRLKTCQSDSCRWAFYDASKNRSGTWCSMEVCGNRTKVRSHRQRKG
ncbi:MAG TPA: CGNR zinc finger domain-containing protein [Trueperaceae bacterium]